MQTNIHASGGIRIHGPSVQMDKAHTSVHTATVTSLYVFYKWVLTEGTQLSNVILTVTPITAENFSQAFVKKLKLSLELYNGIVQEFLWKPIVTTKIILLMTTNYQVNYAAYTVLTYFANK